MWYLLRLQLADTPRQRRRLWSEQQQLLGYVLPLHTLVLLLGLVFCVASPLIAPVTLLYFVSSSVTQRYQWIYIYRHPYEGAGMLWRQVFNQVGTASGQGSVQYHCMYLYILSGGAIAYVDKQYLLRMSHCCKCNPISSPVSSALHPPGAQPSPRKAYVGLVCWGTEWWCSHMRAACIVG